jgi:hypothetical protein
VYGDGLQPKTILTRYDNASRLRAVRRAEVIAMGLPSGETKAPAAAAAARISTNLRPLLASEAQTRYKK